MDICPNRGIRLSILLSYPYFWRPTKICEFVHKALKILRDRKDEKVVHKVIRRIYKYERDPKFCFWPEGSNWKQVLDSYDPHYYEILTIEYKRGKVRKQLTVTDDQLTSACYFLKIIRDKYEHYGDIPTNKKKQLGWYTRKCKGELTLDDNRFLQFWTSKFPRLIPFLWLQFRLLEGELAEYYLYSLNQRFFGNLTVDLENMLVQLSDAVLENLEQGGLLTRYTTTNGKSPPPLTLEFRSCEADMIQGILYGKSAVAIEVIQDKLTFTWEVSTQNRRVTKEMTYRTTLGQFSNLSGTYIVIANACGDVDKRMLNLVSNKCRLIFITSSSNRNNTEGVEAAVANISSEIPFNLEKNPLRYDELRECKRRALESEVFVYLQNRLVKFEVLLPKDVDGRMSLLSWFSGDRLNDLLRRKRIDFLCGRRADNFPVLFQHSQQLWKISDEKWELDLVDEFDIIGEEREGDTGSAIAILGEAAIGKRAVIEKCAKEIGTMFKNTCVILIKMSEFIERYKVWSKRLLLGTHDDSRSSWRECVAQFVIQELIGCSQKFEENVVKFWLYQKRSYNKLRFDMMFDSVDDVQLKDWELAYDLLKTINEEFPSVRVWVTASTYLQNEIEVILKTTTYLLESPFQQELQSSKIAELPVQLETLAELFKQSQGEEENLQEYLRVTRDVEDFANYVRVTTEEEILAVDVRVVREVDMFVEYVRVMREDVMVPECVIVARQEEKLTNYVMVMLGQ